ncbi:polysaccharide deacetylase family protein [Taibaiella soli]|uniref:Polysaccharide deacetylase family protein n=1 Tax=Taibaiella soli TaxID=1649169 RepID=A0A2W2AP67_9BACT|nr:polysaccharide deacetylase family protein [Taibaiella soli]PZF74170.1 polysaccharide deacetylase family protein [Taibaiella soli]
MTFRNTSTIFILLLIALDAGYFFAGFSWGWIVALLVVYVHLLVLGSIYIRWNFYFKSYHSGKDKKQIALTFDDGPAANTAAILDILKAQNVPAAFFSIGKNAAANPELVKRWQTEGHVIGNHSYNHGFNFDWQSAKTMQAEIVQTNNTIASVIGKKPKLFRPPYGVTNPNLAKAVHRSGMHSIGWSLRSFDTKAKDADLLLKKILSQLKGGDIILLHDSMDVTRQILTPLITEARKKGFIFARVDKMLDLEAYE